jgi:dUTP pyrophosphatase
MINIYFTKLKPNAKIPYKRDEDAGYDVYPCFEEDSIIIKPGEIKVVPIGIASAFSDDYYIQVQERGSTGIKGMSTRCGVIDSGYRGEHIVVINNTSLKPIVIAKNISAFSENEFTIHDYNKAIAQYVLLPVPKTEIKELTIDEFKKLNELNFKSERGRGGFGSSQK